MPNNMIFDDFLECVDKSGLVWFVQEKPLTIKRKVGKFIVTVNDDAVEADHCFLVFFDNKEVGLFATPIKYALTEFTAVQCKGLQTLLYYTTQEAITAITNIIPTQ